MVRKRLINAAAAVGLAVTGVFWAGPTALATTGQDNGNGDSNARHKVTLCHATGSETNPFVKIRINVNGAVNGHAGHDNDIIPSFTYKHKGEVKTFAGLNLGNGGQAILDNGCKIGGSGGDEDNKKKKVTLCHATGSETNPFVKIRVSATGAFNGHLGNSHQDGQDIIPPFKYKGETYSQNWDAEGRVIFNNDCKVGGQGGNGNGNGEDEEDEDKEVVVVVREREVGGAGAGQVLGAQVEAPVGAVNAGAGGAAGVSLGSIAGLLSSLAAVGFGLRRWL